MLISPQALFFLFFFFLSLHLLLPLPQPTQPSDSRKDGLHVLKGQVAGDGPGTPSPPSSPFSASWPSPLSLTRPRSASSRPLVLPQTGSALPTSPPATSAPPSLLRLLLLLPPCPSKSLSPFSISSSVCSLSWQSYPSLILKMPFKHQAQGPVLGTVGVVVSCNSFKKLTD